MSDQGSSTGQAACAQSSQSDARQRIHFPIEEEGPRAGIQSSPSAPPSSSKRRTHRSDDGRRRGRSVDVTGRMFAVPDDSQSSSSRPRHLSVSETKRQRMARTAWSDDQLGVVAEDFNAGTSFSDEYDLSRQDPTIIRDVERAMRLKARREARTNAVTVYPHGTSAASTTSSYSGACITSPKTAVPDFSPSVGTSGSSHPIPLSSDNGETLDWTRPEEEDSKRHERKFSLSLKKKGKDKVPSVTGAALDQQEALYATKIARIKADVSMKSIEKADITRQQLGRRYGHLTSDSPPVNLLKAVRWYANQGDLFKESVESAQPFVWLAHLDTKPGKDPLRSRSDWSLSSLIIEEYASYTTTGESSMRTRFETLDSTHSSPNPGSPSHRYNTRIPSQFSLGPSLGPSLSRKRSNDGHVSFEPLLESNRSSLEVDRRKSAEMPSARGWRNSLPGVHKSPQTAHKSPQSSLYGMFGGARAVGTSPTSSRLHLKDLMRGRRAFNESDEALSSGRNSMSEGQSEDIYKDWQNIRGLIRPSVLEFGPDPDHIDIVISRPASDGDDNRDMVFTDTGRPMETVSDGEPTTHVRPSLRATITSPILGSAAPISSTPRAFGRVSTRTFLPEPGPDRTKRKLKEAEEKKERQEYELKAQLLKDMAAQNYRVRQLLHNVAGGLRDYDSVQSDVMKTLDVPYRKLPSELLDAVGHDPASVTGATRRYRGWRAVEDIQSRLLRQRHTFVSFLSVQENETKPLTTSALHEPVEAIMASLDTLELRRKEFVKTAQEVASVLKRVNELHATVKSSYYHALSRVSVAYPETSHIIALDEQHTDQYQQFWELGMNFITLMLDTLTPLWRTYGKTIGEDIQDFLIIPLYRNEFTGEPKRYAIERLPRRSFRHWMGLMLFFATSMVILIAQARAAIWSTVNFRLTWLRDTPGLRWTAFPFFWGFIIGQWCAVLFELGSVVAQFGIIAWWVAWMFTMVGK